MGDRGGGCCAQIQPVHLLCERKAHAVRHSRVGRLRIVKLDNGRHDMKGDNNKTRPKDDHSIVGYGSGLAARSGKQETQELYARKSRCRTDREQAQNYRGGSTRVITKEM